MAAGGVTALHVETPPGALDALTERGLLDRVIVFVTPTLGASGASQPGDSAQLVQPSLSVCASTLHSVTYERLGDTVLVTGYLPDSSPGHHESRQAG